ncbi:helix-turn-helix domain-containing protein [Populibacterium corticicola]|uniref:Helix-turn-helix domain-containing protein n=1 Tax=Populibacterium corticicola TaxID=1812826 RepID=A0ABW5XC22_9MICO
MAAAMTVGSQISVDGDTLTDARETLKATPVGRGRFVFLDEQSNVVELPDSVQRLLGSTLQTLAREGSVRINSIPSELSSTTAARIIGISRPTLMKWVSEGRVPAFKVGSHTRFNRDDVMAFCHARSQAQRVAFETMRQDDEEFDI